MAIARGFETLMLKTEAKKKFLEAKKKIMVRNFYDDNILVYPNQMDGGTLDLTKIKK
jgi:hypothetical protein